VETEKTLYWAFTPWTDGDNLGRTRIISAYCVYDLPVDPTAAASSEAKQKAVDAGLTPGNLQNLILQTGRLWSDGNKNSSFVENVGAPQMVKWVDEVIVEHDVVVEQPDRWLIWTIVKNKLKPQDVRINGPRDIKKTGFAYQYPYPIDPPKIKLENRSAGIFVEVKGGGSVITNPYFGDRGRIDIPADRYNIYRKKVAEPPRTHDDDPFGWGPDSAVGSSRSLITDTVVEEFDGTPASALPPQASYTEPGDDSEPEEPYETTFELIATVDNAKVAQRSDFGYGDFFDQDVVDGAEYEYYATAVISEAESPDSNHETIIYSGPEHHQYRMGMLEGGRGADATAPSDPEIPDDDYGETEEFIVPFEPDEEVFGIPELMDDIAPRVFAQNEPDFRIDMGVLIPLLGLEYGQEVEMPVIEWDVYANDLHIGQETENDDWMLAGFKMKFERTNDGSWKSQKTTLTLQERSKN
jgi:hypothetical protein